MSAFHELVDFLQLQPVDNASAIGDVEARRTKVTFLSDEPLSLLFSFYVGANKAELPNDLGPLLDAGKVEIALEDGFVWLTLLNLLEPSGEEIGNFIRQVVGALKAAGFALDGCGLCGHQNAPLQLLDNRAIRICEMCLEAKQRETEDLNRSNPGEMLYVPVGILSVALGWTVSWVLIDLFIEWLNAGKEERDLVINKLTLIPIAGLGLMLFMLGWMLGAWMWKSGLSRFAPRLMAVVALLIATLLGEFLYVMITLWRQVQVLDFRLTAMVFWMWIGSYSAGWIFLKIGLAVCAYFGCQTGGGNKIASKVA